MHPCLSISEIVTVICTHLVSGYFDPDEPQYARSLLSFSLTCKDILDPALDALWETQTGVVPLLRCMHDVWGERENFTGYGDIPALALFPQRPILRSDWTRFKKYAHRVKYIGHRVKYTGDPRHISLKPSHKVGIYATPECFREMANSAPAWPICPSIYDLDWPPPDCAPSMVNDVFPYIRMFIGAATRRLTLRLTGINIANATWLPRLTEHLSDLRELILGNAARDIVPAVEDALLKIRSLESLTWIGADLPGVSARVLAHLARLPYLKNLTITTAPGGVWGPLPLSHSRTTFFNLQSLTLANLHILSVATLIKSMSHCRLVDLKIFDTNRENHASDLAALITVVSTHCSHLSLKHLRIVGSYCRPSDDWIVTEDVMRGLRAFTNLVTVSIRLALSFSVGDGYLNQLAIDWKNLEVLELGRETVGWGGESRLTLAGLVTLATLPRLQCIFIVIDATKPIGGHDGIVVKASNCALVRLPVGDSLIDDPSKVASLLGDLFPALREISSWTPPWTGGDVEGSDDYKLMWKEVGDLIKSRHLIDS